MKLTKFFKKIIFVLPFTLLTSCDSPNKNSNFDFPKDSFSIQDEKQEFDFVDENENNWEMSHDDEQSILHRLQYNNTVYFDLNKYQIRSEFFNMLDEYAEFLLQHPSYTITIEGHTDIRGTPDYNILLGNRRSNAVKEYLENKGVSSNQIHTVSYGKEKLATSGNDEFSHAKNRRTVNILTRE
ncbi:MAG: peptidoglycan-associated outer membrane lipoprotein Pal [Candidatus Westeberhardia cardiocondylae]|nr:peptidoglycan-associated outer membrane lipoprotein Pal [Candidatus Westeberhardia cardiocondylae]